MPVPPPGGFAAPADDWSDDPSFDLSPDRSFPGSSPSSSTSSRGSSSRPSLGMGPSPASRLTGSPLRQMHKLQLKKSSLAPELDDDDFDDFDLPDDAFVDGGSTIKALPQPLLNFGTIGSSSTPKAPRTISAASNTSGTSSIRSITATVMGQGPAGVGTITRLGSKPASAVLPVGSVRARARAIEKQWEADVEFGSVSDVRLKTTLSPVKKIIMPDADALDDLGFDLADEDDQATLKASATLKAMLPPPRARNGSGGDTVKGPPSAFLARKSNAPAAPAAVAPPAKEGDIITEDDLETDLVLPLNLTNLTLASQSQQTRPLRPRHSMTSVTTDWDSPSTSISGIGGGRFSWGDESARHGRNSETSMTSISDGPPEKSKDDLIDNEDEEDYEVDLVIPDPSFFASRQATTLNQILDKKRKQQFAPPPPQRLQLDTPHGGDDSFEDGLVFDNPRTELSHRRLEKNRRMRTVPVPFTLGAERKTKAPTTTSEKERERERLGRQSPSVPTSAREGTSSSLGRTSGRNLSSASQKDSRSRPTSPLTYMRDQLPPRAPSRNRLTAASYLPPPPVPPVPPLPPVPTSARMEPSTPSRLRSQKSFHHLPPSQSPSLVRKQSLASLQDAIAAGHFRPDSDLGSYDGHTLRPVKSSSRLTQPTTSSLAKMRAPVHHTTSREQLRLPPVPRVRAMDMPRRTKDWGDGTELEGIEDLRVETPPTPSYPKLGRKSLERSPGATKEAEPLRKKSGGKPRRQRQPAMLIKNLGAVDKKKVVGEMTWNPQTLRWEGNESILRDFDTVASSARPALITHFTGSAPHSPLHGGGAPAVRIVGDMKFDPEKMCWVSLLPPEEDEPDPFEGMADDEDDTGLRGTLTRLSGRKLVSIGLSGGSSAPSAPSTRFVSESAHSVATTTASWEDRTLPQVGAEISPELWTECRDAEERHRREMRGWTLRPAQSSSDLRDRDRREEKRLWEVRNLALRS